MSRAAVFLFVFLSIGVAESSAQPTTAPASDDFSVYLATVGPGEAAYEKFGHSMIWLIDRRTREGISYNYGIFDFNQPNFYGRFIMGRMLYRMAAVPLDLEFGGYLDADRTVRLQELNFNPAQKAALRQFFAWNLRPENASYRYDYFHDNCATRPRDALDGALGGQIAAQTKDMPATDGRTLRHHVRQCTGKTPWLYVALDYCLGRPIDGRISRWEEMFSPAELAEHLGRITVRDDNGASIPLVKTDRLLHRSRRHHAASIPPTVWPMYLTAGVVLAATIVSLGAFAGRWKLARLAFTLLVTLWSTLAAAGGWLMAWAWLTDHAAAKFNENILLLSPLALGLVFLVPLSLWKPARFARPAWRVALACCVLALLALPIKLLPPWPAQSNWGLMLLAIPINAAFALALWRSERFQIEAKRAATY